MGGALRDALLGLPVRDVDVACRDARGLAGALAAKARANLVVLDEKTQVFRVIPSGGPPGVQADLAEIQGATIEEDLARRDFTANALALPLPIAEREPLDPFGGLADIRNKVLRHTSGKVFADDPLRLLRAFRIAAQRGFRIDPGTLSAVSKHRRLVSSPAPERLRAEVLGILGAGDSARWLESMDQTGLLTELFPELEPQRRCADVYYGEGGVLRHTLDSVARMDLLLSRLDDCLGPLAEPVRGHLESLPGGAEAQGALLRLAALLHDAAKPDCARLIGGRLRFFGHEEAGAKAAEAVLRRLRFSREEREAVSEWIRHHLRPGNLAANEAVSDRAVYRFFRDLKGQGIRQLLLCWADHASYLDEPELLSILGWACEDPHAFRPPRAIPEETAKTLRHLQVIAFLLSRWFLEPETVRPKRILDGNDVMKALGLPPGPAVGEILSELEEAQATGRVRTREEALRFVSGRIPPPG